MASLTAASPRSDVTPGTVPSTLFGLSNPSTPGPGPQDEAGPVARFDNAIDELFVGLRGNPLADRLFFIASEGADYSRAWHAIGAVMAMTSPSRRGDALRLAVALGIESAFVNGLLKNLIPRERPPLIADAAFDVRRPKTKSFPSGHASSATMTAVLLGDAMPKLKPLWWVLAATVSASRVHNRMHHGSDVAAGALIGAATGILTKRVWPLRQAGP